MRLFQPFQYLFVRLWLAAIYTGIGRKHVPPEGKLLVGGIFRAEVIAPPIRKALQPGAFGARQPADYVFRLFPVCDRRVFVIPRHQGWKLFL